MKYRSLSCYLAIFCLLHLNFMSSAQNTNEQTPYYEMILSIEPEKKLLRNKLIMVVDTAQLINRTISLSIASSAHFDSIEGEGLTDKNIHSTDGTLKQITLTFKDQKGPEVSIKMEYSLEIPDSPTRSHISEQWIELSKASFWYPAFTYPTPFKYSMQLELDQSYQIITGDFLLESKSPDNNFLIMSRLPRRDIAFSAAKNLTSAEGEYSIAYATTAAEKLEKLLSSSDSSLKFLASYINRPDDFNHKRQIVTSDMLDTTYAQKNYIVLSATENKSAKEFSRSLTHEYSHYWFSVANPDSKHVWLSESFAEYLSLIFLRENYGQQAFEHSLDEKRKELVNDRKAMTEYTERPSYAALYHKGPLILYQFEQYIGEKQFRKLLNRMVDLQVGTNEDFYNLISTEFQDGALDEMYILLSTM